MSDDPMDDAIEEVLLRIGGEIAARNHFDPRVLLVEEGVNPEQWATAMEAVLRTALLVFEGEHVGPFVTNVAFVAGMHYERNVQEALKANES